METYIALDAGTTLVRAIAFDLEGNIVSKAASVVELHYRAPGLVEQDPIEITDSAIKVLAEVASTLKEKPAAIGIANQRETALGWNRHDKTPLSMAISWQDRRGLAKCESLKDHGLTTLIAQKTGLVINPYFSATKFADILSAQNNSSREQLVLGTLDSWLIANLTNSPKQVTDYSNASRTSLFNLDTNQYDEELSEVFQVPTEYLCEPLASDSYFGEISHKDLKDLWGIPIHGVLGDQQASLFGQGCIEERSAKITLGTGSFLLVNTGSQREETGQSLINSIAWNLRGKGNTYCTEGPIFATESILNWLHKQLGIPSSPEEFEDLARSVRTSDQVTIIPFFEGAGAPWWSPDARATIGGLSPSTNKGHIARAALESISLQITDITDTLTTQSGSPPEMLSIDGGLSKIDLLCQLIADQSGIKCSRAMVREATPLGAAMMAAYGLGHIQISHMTEIQKAGETFVPSTSRIAANTRQRRWKAYLAKLGFPQ